MFNDFSARRNVKVIIVFSATQEASFVQGIIAAGIMHTLTRRCSLGHFTDCGCDDSKKGIRGKWAELESQILILKKSTERKKHNSKDFLIIFCLFIRFS